jgi:GMP synthase-like glutamine amidotransferase
MTPALVIQHGPLGPPGLLGEWMADRGIPMVVHRADNGGSWPDPREHLFVAVLGSRHSPGDTDEPAVVATREHVEQALDADVPVLGLCFGGQLLASVLGGEVGNVPGGPELGWFAIDTDDPERVPAGPWLQWHWHCFTTPPGAEEVARSASGTQAFRHGPHLGVQFHPESTIEIVARWAESDAARLADLGLSDRAAALEEGRAHAEQAARNARMLFDGFLHGARNGRRGELDGAP